MVFYYLQAYGYSKIGITFCPSEWYQYLAHGLNVIEIIDLILNEGTKQRKGEATKVKKILKLVTLACNFLLRHFWKNGSRSSPQF